MRASTYVLIVVVFMVCLGLIAVGQSTSQSAAASKIRIGTYDNRAIAVAYAASQFNANALREKMAEMEVAKKAGDQKKIAELKAWGNQLQRTLHFQGFARVPVEDLLEPVKAQVAKVSEQQGLAVITAGCTYSSERVEVVDVTAQLVELFKPSEKTRKVAQQITTVKPELLTTIADMPVNE